MKSNKINSANVEKLEDIEKNLLPPRLNSAFNSALQGGLSTSSPPPLGGGGEVESSILGTKTKLPRQFKYEKKKTFSLPSEKLRTYRLHKAYKEKEEFVNTPLISNKMKYENLRRIKSILYHSYHKTHRTISCLNFVDKSKLKTNNPKKIDKSSKDYVLFMRNKNTSNVNVKVN